MRVTGTMNTYLTLVDIVNKEGVRDGHARRLEDRTIAGKLLAIVYDQNSGPEV